MFWIFANTVGIKDIKGGTQVINPRQINTIEEPTTFYWLYRSGQWESCILTYVIKATQNLLDVLWR